MLTGYMFQFHQLGIWKDSSKCELHITKRNIDLLTRYDCDIIFICVYGSVIRNCYKIGDTRPHPLTVNFIPNMRHSLYILSMVSGLGFDSIKQVLLNPEHPEKYMLEMHRIALNYMHVLMVLVYEQLTWNLTAKS